MIGRGAVGSVYGVEQVFLKKRFALKKLIPGSTTDNIIRRFQKAAPPFRAQTALATMMQHREDKPYSLREASLGQEFPEALERIIGMMLAKDPADRYSTGGDVASDFLWLQQGRPERV